MRVTCFFVSVAIMLVAEQTSAVPIGGLPKLPVLGNEGRLVSSVANTLEPVPLIGDLTHNVLQDQSSGDLLSSTKLAGEKGLIHDDGVLGDLTRSLQRRVLSDTKLIGEGGLIDLEGTLDEVTRSLERRELGGLDLLGTVGSLTNGVQTLPVLGSVGSILPVTQGLTSKLGSLNGAHQASPLSTSGLLIPHLLKRDVGLGSLPLIGSLPGASSLSAIPGLSSLPSMPSLPGMGSLPSIPGMSSLPSIPGMSSLPSIPGMSSLPSIPGMDSLPSIPGMSSLTSLPKMASSSIPGMSSLPSIPGVGGLTSGGLPGMSSLSNLL